MQTWRKVFLMVVLAFFSIAPPAGADPVAGKKAYKLPSTLPPALFSGRTADAYGVAAEIPEVLAGLACYCGCDQSVGHRHLLDCFADDHGVG